MDQPHQSAHQGIDHTGTEKAWEQEARALELINELNHNHIIKCLAAIRRGSHRYFMFPWANGGSLRDYWEATPEQTPTADNIRQAVIQIHGLAEALYQLHNFEGKPKPQEADLPKVIIPDVRLGDVLLVKDEGQSASIRHGDLKPENILRFLSGQRQKANKTDLGVLKLADMGLAKRHIVSTQDRKCLTSTRYGTIQYEAPETKTALEARSRLYDIWSMGCIVLEFVIWLLYGNKELGNFHKQVKGQAQETQFFEIRDDRTGVEVHRVVRRWMDHIQNEDPECSQQSAISDLLDLVKTKLLIVDLPPRRDSLLGGNPGPFLQPPGPGEGKRIYRATAESFLVSLDAILSRLNEESYVLTGKKRDNVKPPVAAPSSFLSTSSAFQRQQPSNLRKETALVYTTRNRAIGKTRADYSLPPLEGWEFPVDNDFAVKVISRLGPLAINSQSSTSSTLCGRCKRLNFWKGGFSIEDETKELQEKSSTCDFCRMLWEACTAAGATKGPKARFERDQSTLRLSGSQSLPVLSIFRSPGKLE